MKKIEKIEEEITDCHSFCPNPWHNLPSSYLAINAITCKGKYIHGNLFLSPNETPLKVEVAAVHSRRKTSAI
ncbi:hypothetical protein CMV_019169 [Castanea mollissima]|uniref:Uncharacterized protein n=1 Tax=Castanea mollissima TaxID=60419 RepID=A0A8J4QYU7_9ROSI|nr:hypothetical protein CMV_019169 [Castanea mollissima]